MDCELEKAFDPDRPIIQVPSLFLGLPGSKAFAIEDIRYVQCLKVNEMTTSWYVLHSKPQKEGFLFRQLCLRDIRSYYPCLEVKPVNPRSRSTRPYFPGYLFIGIDPDKESFSSLQWLPGAVGIVEVGGEPAPVPDCLVEEIRKQVDRINHEGPKPSVHYSSGERVSIIDGPLTGYRAIFDRQISESDRVRVLLELVQNRKVCVKLPAWQLKSS